MVAAVSALLVMSWVAAVAIPGTAGWCGTGLSLLVLLCGSSCPRAEGQRDLAVGGLVDVYDGLCVGFCLSNMYLRWVFANVYTKCDSYVPSAAVR